MKKPNITEGEWTVRSDEAQSCVYIGYFNKPKVEVVADIWANKKEYLANAKAISAAPEMIDALIESTNLLQELKDVIVDQEAINEINQQIEMNKYSALKKAGCTE